MKYCTFFFSYLLLSQWICRYPLLYKNYMFSVWTMTHHRRLWLCNRLQHFPHHKLGHPSLIPNLLIQLYKKKSCPAGKLPKLSITLCAFRWQNLFINIDVYSDSCECGKSARAWELAVVPSSFGYCCYRHYVVYGFLFLARRRNKLGFAAAACFLALP